VVGCSVFVKSIHVVLSHDVTTPTLPTYMWVYYQEIRLQWITFLMGVASARLSQYCFEHRENIISILPTPKWDLQGI